MLSSKLECSRVEQLAREANLDEVTVEMVEQARLEFGQ